jgi:DNA-binding NarL/FixJ family response regulator
VRQRVFIVVAVKAWAQLLADRIERQFEVIGSAADGAGALAELERSDAQGGIVVIDAGAQLALPTASALLRSDATIRLVAVALDEEPGQAMEWASAGAIGLVGRTASVDELLDTLTEVARGEASCSAGISGALVRGITNNNGGSRLAGSAAPLTERELEVAWLVASGLTNKEIATRLQISPGTVKSHVHKVIRKLGVGRRAHVSGKLSQDSRLPPAFPSSIPLTAYGVTTLSTS